MTGPVFWPSAGRRPGAAGLKGPDGDVDDPSMGGIRPGGSSGGSVPRGSGWRGTARGRAALLDALPDVVVVIDAAGRIEWANRAAERAFGRSLADTVGISGLELVHPDDLAFALLSLGTVQEKEVGTPIEVRLRTAGGWRLMELVGARVPGSDEGSGEGPGEGSVLLSLRDLTDRRRYELSHDHDGRFRTLVQNAAALIMLVSPTGEVVSCSGAVTRMLGHDSDLVEGRPLSALAVEEDRRAVDAVLARSAHQRATDSGPLTISVSLVRAGSPVAVPFELTVVNLVDDPTVEGYVVSGHDITDRKILEEQLAYQAFHDSLTGLGNRALFQDRLSLALARTLRTGRRTALLFLDVDDFKAVNDRFGHAAGDAVLRAVATRIEGCLRAVDTAARLGGDEFGVLVEDIEQRGDALALGERLLGACRRPVVVGDRAVRPTLSVGVACSVPGTSVDELLLGADRAMYEAKLRGKDRCLAASGDPALAAPGGPALAAPGGPALAAPRPGPSAWR